LTTDLKPLYNVRFGGGCVSKRRQPDNPREDPRDMVCQLIHDEAVSSENAELVRQMLLILIDNHRPGRDGDGHGRADG